MTDINGNPVTPGSRVRFRAELREGEWLSWMKGALA
jgi:hypothetical protein